VVETGFVPLTGGTELRPDRKWSMIKLEQITIAPGDGEDQVCH
jgi:hypothetical protein